MAQFSDRVASFMARFNATQEQASRLLGEIDRLNRDDNERSIASRIMQDDAFKKIGYAYMDRDPEYLAGQNRNDAYRRIMREITDDIINEVYEVSPKEPAAPSVR
jgi:hypothetical protein